MKRLVSGIQTSGDLHLGNYLGCIKNWVILQNEYQSLFFLADLHSLTVPYNRDDLRRRTLEVAATYIACGIDPNKAIIFNQSSVAAHTELSWLLSCITSMGLMNRMTQFKDKAGKDKEKASLGLYSYPVLMAADILIYNADIVPVGDDQKQHLELTRHIAETFNRMTNTNFFKIPEPYIMGQTTRVMSLRDGKAKMSKSDPSDYSRINLFDSSDLIAKKIKKATSDSIVEIYFDKEKRPEVSNLLAIFAALSEESIEKITDEYSSQGFAAFKNALADLAVAKITPISQKIQELLNAPDYLLTILKQGSSKANEIAKKNSHEIKELFGLLNL